ncbi:MAG TPA: NAD(+) kinase [Steroidobacteraceae bacterium]|jgi:NAD+ kinase|nr:NAD(+) kinase [Steroidobacteraceae bacterium]
MAKPFQTFALVGRDTDMRVADSMRTLAGHLVKRGGQVLVDQASTVNFGSTPVTRADPQGFADRADLLIAIGGDGTMLHASRLAVGRKVPLLGVNRGRLGFLTDVSPEDMLERLDDVLAGKYTEDRRSLLEARLNRGGRIAGALTALNDVVVQKWETGRMLDIETWIDGQFVNTHGADGLVVASATGSTAYALSCGGPIVQHRLGAVVLVPISPHTLSDRPIVVSADARIELRLKERVDTRAQVLCDGAVLGELDIGDRLEISASQHHVTLIHPPGYEYFRLLRSKLHWGRGGYDGSAGTTPPAER